jgi:hypothetical protein
MTVISETRKLTDWGVHPDPEQVKTAMRRVLRKLKWGVHFYRRKGKLVTIDVPFTPMVSRNGEKMAFMIEESRLPRNYSLEHINQAEPVIEREIGFPVKIREISAGQIAICVDISNAGTVYQELP